MAKKKEISQENLISWYMEYVLENGEDPKSVYSFAKQHGFEEAKFYELYGSFQALRQGIFTTFHQKTLLLLEESTDYQNFDSRNKLLTYYYTFLEMLTANRSYVVYSLGDHGDRLRSLQELGPLKKEFMQFIDTLGIETLDLKRETLRKMQEKSIRETAWFQFLIILKFWLEDTSAGFEKTDIFVEKAIKATFDLIDTTPVKSVIDLGKFLFKEKMPMN